MLRTLRIAIIAATFGILPLAHAAGFNDSQYFRIANVKTMEIPTPPDYATNTPPPQTAGVPAPTIGIGDISNIVNIGKQIWNIVEANKPVANVTTNSANALPKGISDWSQLEGWEIPQTHTYQTTFTNLYGMNVVVFEYRVSYTAGGSYRGTGQYLTHVTVDPSNLYVAWGYKFNAQAAVPSITNAGTTRSPIAAADVLVKWSVDTILSHVQQSAEYYVRGDGQFTALQ